MRPDSEKNSSGEPGGIHPRFIGFVEREISRRWGRVIDWPDRMWQRYESTALVGEDSELRAFEYILSQGAKEHLVASPLEWPGVHCARDLERGKKREGTWFDGTAYGKAVHAQRANVKPRPVRKADYRQTYLVALDRLPAFAGVSGEEYRQLVQGLVSRIEKTAASERKVTGKKVLGRRAVLRVSRERRSKLPPQPWYEGRRRMVVWADRFREATQAYLQRYWEFQKEFRIASQLFCAGDITAPFPRGAFRPSVLIT